MASQAYDAARRARRLLDLRDAYRERFQSETAAARLLQVVDLLFEAPVLTIPGIAEVLGVYYRMAARYVRALEEAGVLREVTGGQRNRVYHADEVLHAIQAPIEDTR